MPKRNQGERKQPNQDNWEERRAKKIDQALTPGAVTCVPPTPSTEDLANVTRQVCFLADGFKRTVGEAGGIDYTEAAKIQEKFLGALLDLSKVGAEMAKAIPRKRGRAAVFFFPEQLKSLLSDDEKKRLLNEPENKSSASKKNKRKRKPAPAAAEKAKPAETAPPAETKKEEVTGSEKPKVAV